MIRNAFFALGAAIVVVLTAILSVTLFFVVIGVMVALVLVRLVGEVTWMRGRRPGPQGPRGTGPGDTRRPGGGKVIEGEFEAHWADETPPKPGEGPPRDDHRPQ